MTIKEIIQKLRITMDDARGQESHFESWLTQNEGICDAIDMLKELDKQEQGEPVAWLSRRYVDNFPVSGYETAQPTDYGAFPVYTTPPAAQRTWVGLTDEEMQECIKTADYNQGQYKRTPYWAHLSTAIEAKLKQKNGYAEENT
jgi:hypothetical protein